jgi:hypothetical protein
MSSVVNATPWPDATDDRLATTRHKGLMPKADKAKLDAATSAATASTLLLRDASGDAALHNLTVAFFNAVSVAGFTDANGWTGALLLSGKRIWCQRVTVNSGYPAATAWANMFTTALPTGMANLGAVRFSFGFFASTWARVMTLAPDATTASTTIVMNGTLAAGPGNWNTINPVVVFDLQCIEI